MVIFKLKKLKKVPGIHKVLTFAEKPNYATAVRFLESGDFIWNSGMFIWKVSSILEEIRIYLPDLWDGLEEIKKELNTADYNKKLLGKWRN